MKGVILITVAIIDPTPPKVNEAEIFTQGFSKVAKHPFKLG